MEDFKEVISTIAAARSHVEKNFSEMDLENCDLRDEIESECEEIVRICNNMIIYTHIKSLSRRS